jgi:hypothetical protein
MSDPGLKGALHPALRPENVHAILKEKYQIPAKARSLFRDMPEPLDEYRDILSKDMVGAIGDLSGDDGFKFVDSQFESSVGIIKGFGGAFKMTYAEKKWSRIDLVSKKMRDLVYAMQKHYERKVLTAIANATGINSFDGSNWTDTSNGDPFSDLEKAKGLVSDSHGISPDIVIMNRSQYLRLIKFKEYREYRLLGRSNYETKNLWDDLTPNGLQMVIFDDSMNTLIPDHTVFVCKSKDMGVNHQAVAFESFDREDKDSPLGTNYYAHEWTTPAVDKVDALAICKVFGLNA